MLGRTCGYGELLALLLRFCFSEKEAGRRIQLPGTDLLSFIAGIFASLTYCQNKTNKQKAMLYS